MWIQIFGFWILIWIQRHMNSEQTEFVVPVPKSWIRIDDYSQIWIFNMNSLLKTGNNSILWTAFEISSEISLLLHSLSLSLSLSLNPSFLSLLLSALPFSSPGVKYWSGFVLSNSGVPVSRRVLGVLLVKEVRGAAARCFQPFQFVPLPSPQWLQICPPGTKPLLGSRPWLGKGRFHHDISVS